MVRRFILTFALLAATIAIATPAAATPKSDAGLVPWTPDVQIQATYRIWNNHTNECILVRGGDNGGPVVQWGGCASAHYADQDWYFRSAGDGYYYIVNNNSQKCLLSRTSNNLAVQWDCLNYIDQHWRLLTYQGWSIYLIQNRASGKCLVVQSGGVQAFTYDCHTEFADQWWYFT